MPRPRRMIRDSLVPRLLAWQMTARGQVQAEAAGILLRFCRQGFSDAEIGEALETSGLSGELTAEITALAAEVGISLPAAERC